MMCMRMVLLLRALALLAPFSVVVVPAGCGDDGGPPPGFEGVCRSCIGDQPVGPNESREACEAFAEEYGCQTASLSGSCSNPDLANKAVCRVQGCDTQPVCPTPE